MPRVLSPEMQLCAASEVGDVGAVKRLLAAHPTMNVDHKDPFEFTPLIHASLYGHVDVVRDLLQRGATVNARNCDGCTPLIVASLWSQCEVVKVLLKAGSDMNAEDYSYNTPLMCACKRGNQDIVNVLLAAGCDIESKKASPAIKIARYYRFHSIAQAIENEREWRASRVPARHLRAYLIHLRHRQTEELTNLAQRKRQHQQQQQQHQQQKQHQHQDQQRREAREEQEHDKCNPRVN